MGISRSHTFDALQSAVVDVLTDTVMHNMERDVFLQSAGSGFTFSTPYFYAESKFMGVPEYVDCADRLDGWSASCRDLRVCVSAGSIQDSILKDLLPGSDVVSFARTDDKWPIVVSGRSGGRCELEVL